MELNKSINFKAFFFLVIFITSFIIGFICSLGFEQEHKFRFNDFEKNNLIAHKHTHAIDHSHNGSESPDHHKNSQKEDIDHPINSKNNDKENCCNDEVLGFHQSDKLIINPINIVHPDYVAILIYFCSNSSLKIFGYVKDVKPFVRNNHPPIPDIRIAIQSFQI